MLAPAALCLVSLGFLLVAELFDRRPLKYLSKPLASLGFVWAAVSVGATQSAYGQVLLVGLVLGMLGDLLLLSSATPLFLGGLAAFLLGHLAYIVAFAVHGVWWFAVPPSLFFLSPVGLGVLGWLWRRLDGPMRPAVIAYVVTICGMVALAIAGRFAGAPWRQLLGAVLFMASDLAVARERFVHSTVLNRLWGLPTYYVAQLLLASTAGE